MWETGNSSEGDLYQVFYQANGFDFAPLNKGSVFVNAHSKTSASKKARNLIKSWSKDKKIIVSRAKAQLYLGE